jgi:hypothetical protein
LLVAANHLLFTPIYKAKQASMLLSPPAVATYMAQVSVGRCGQLVVQQNVVKQDCLNPISYNRLPPNFDFTASSTASIIKLLPVEGFSRSNFGARIEMKD